MEDNQDKIRALRELLEQDPGDSVGFYMLGRELNVAGLFGQAEEPLRKCIALNASYTAAYRELGVALEKGGNPAAAVEAYETGIAKSDETRDLQTGKEMRVFLNRVKKRML